MQNIKIYDRGNKAIDRYTIFTDNIILTMCNNPISPQGFCQTVHPEHVEEGDHLGKLITLEKLPSKVIQKLYDLELINSKLVQTLQNPKKCTVKKLVQFTKTQIDYNYVMGHYLKNIDSCTIGSVGYELYNDTLKLYIQELKGYKQKFILNYGFNK